MPNWRDTQFAQDLIARLSRIRVPAIRQLIDTMPVDNPPPTWNDAGERVIDSPGAIPVVETVEMRQEVDAETGEPTGEMTVANITTRPLEGLSATPNRGGDGFELQTTEFETEGEYRPHDFFPLEALRRGIGQPVHRRGDCFYLGSDPGGGPDSAQYILSAVNDDGSIHLVSAGGSATASGVHEQRVDSPTFDPENLRQMIRGVRGNLPLILDEIREIPQEVVEQFLREGPTQELRGVSMVFTSTPREEQHPLNQRFPGLHFAGDITQDSLRDAVASLSGPEREAMVNAEFPVRPEDRPQSPIDPDRPPFSFPGSLHPVLGGRVHRPGWIGHIPGVDAALREAVPAIARRIFQIDPRNRSFEVTEGDYWMPASGDPLRLSLEASWTLDRGSQRVRRQIKLAFPSPPIGVGDYYMFFAVYVLSPLPGSDRYDYRSTLRLHTTGGRCEWLASDNRNAFIDGVFAGSTGEVRRLASAATLNEAIVNGLDGQTEGPAVDALNNRTRSQMGSSPRSVMNPIDRSEVIHRISEQWGPSQVGSVLTSLSKFRADVGQQTLRRFVQLVREGAKRILPKEIGDYIEIEAPNGDNDSANAQAAIVVRFKPSGAALLSLTLSQLLPDLPPEPPKESTFRRGERRLEID